MDALQASGVMPATADAAEQTTVAMAVPLNPLAREFVPAVAGRATTAALNPLAEDFVPVGVPALNPQATEFVPVGVPALNPLAAEFVPRPRVGGGLSADAPEFVVAPPAPELYYQDAPTDFVGYPAAGAYDDLFNAVPPRTWRTRGSNYSQVGRARFSQRVQRIHKQEYVRRTIYVTNIDLTVTEEVLAEFFGRCGIVVDCRICGDPPSCFRFAFIEFQYQEDAIDALHLDGVIIGLCPLKVAPSRTAIMPIKHSFLPQSEEERERSSRTIYCTNIQKTVTPAELKRFCREHFGPVSHVRILGHDNHATQIAFIEFTEASSAIIALSSSDVYAKGLPIRVSPSKTPVRANIYAKPSRDN